MRRVPHYYTASILQLLRKLKLTPANVVPPTVDSFLSKAVQRKLSRHQTLCQNDIQLLESQLPQSSARIINTIAPYPPLEDLLQVWDTMRGCIYGGEGLATCGLYLKHRSRNSGGSRVSANARKDLEDDWFFQAVGATTIPQVEVLLLYVLL